MSLTRRRFLEDSLLAAAAAMSASAAGRRASAQNAPAAAPAGGRAGPNDRIRVAVIGVRGQGRAHIRWLLDQQDVEIPVICDADLAADIVGPPAEMIEKRSGKKPAVVQDFRKILDDKSIDAITTATPDHWHTLVSIWAMQAGKDVYCEKPVSHNLREGRLLVEWARKLDRIAQTGMQTRSHPGVMQGIEYLRSGKLGKIMTARALSYNPRVNIGRAGGDQPVPPTIDYDLWCGPAPKKPLRRLKLHYDWHWFWDYGTGDIANTGVHQLDVCRWGLGKQTHPKSVVSFGGRYAYDNDDGETPNTQVTVYGYDDVLLVSEVRNLGCPAYKNVNVGIVFHCQNGTLVSDKNIHAVAFDPDGKVVKEFNGDGDHMRNFIDAVKSRKREELHAEILEGHLSSSICHLGNVSYRLGKPQLFDPKVNEFEGNPAGEEAFARMREHLAAHEVDLAKVPLQMGRVLKFDPATETFPGDADANALLRREYRKPFVVPEPA